MKKKQPTLVYVKRIQDNTKHFKKQTKPQLKSLFEEQMFLILKWLQQLMQGIDMLSLH